MASGATFACPQVTTKSIGNDVRAVDIQPQTTQGTKKPGICTGLVVWRCPRRYTKCAYATAGDAAGLMACQTLSASASVVLG